MRYLGNKLLLQVRILLRALTRRLLLRRERISGEFLLLLPVVVHIVAGRLQEAGHSARRSARTDDDAEAAPRRECFTEGVCGNLPRGRTFSAAAGARSAAPRGPSGVLPPMSKSLKKIMDAVQADQEVRVH